MPLSSAAGDVALEPNAIVRLGPAGGCEITHGRSRTTLHTATYRGLAPETLPPDLDLIAAAIGTSVLASIEELVERAEFLRPDVAVHVRIKPRPMPTRLTEVHVTILLPRAPSSFLRLNLMRAAETCMARRAIDPRVKVLVSITPTEM